MRLGSDVPGIYTDAWRFVESDSGDVAKKVKEYDRDAALVFNQRDHHLGIARFFRDPELGSIWVIAFRLRDPVTGGYWYGEPNGAILRQLAQNDSLKKPRGHQARMVKQLLELREERERKARVEINGEQSERFVHKWRKAKGLKHRIYVPAGYE